MRGGWDSDWNVKKSEASEWWVELTVGGAHTRADPNAGCSSAYLSLRWPRFRGPGRLFCFECRDPMGQGAPPGNKILVWVNECKPREKERYRGPMMAREWSEFGGMVLASDYTQSPGVC